MTVAVGTGGQIEVYNHAGTVDVDVDVDGYYTGVGGTGSVLRAARRPVRVADTRTASLVGTGTPIAANASESFILATTASGIPATATSVAANFTVVAGADFRLPLGLPGTGHDAPRQTSLTSTGLPAALSRTSPIADTNGTGSVEVYNSYGTINLVVDVFGYFMPLTAGPLMVSAVVTDDVHRDHLQRGRDLPDWSGHPSAGLRL